MNASADTPGLDLPRLAEWLSDTVPGFSPDELSARVISGGKSNLTYLVTSGDSACVVRRPPLGHVLETAHDMNREYRVMTALRDTPVPVPRTFALCADRSVLGVTFYAMEFVTGTIHRDASGLAELGEGRTRQISESLVDTMRALHAIDPEAVGLGDFGRPDGYLARQVRRWRTQLDASSSRELRGAAELHTLLVEHTPATSRSTIVHGDFRLDNLLVGADGHVAAVLDWEMATLGDPLTDLALMLVYQRLNDYGVESVLGDAAQAPGFLTERETIDRYAQGGDLPALGFHVGLASYKLAAILEGIHFRHLSGQTVGEGFEHIGDAVDPLLESGIAAIKELSQ